jgi:type II secretory pathway pseudopilin PulG
MLNLTVTQRRYLTAGAAAVIVLLVALTTLHLGTQISGSAQRTLYRQTVAVVTGERDYAAGNEAQYPPWIGDLATANPRLDFVLGDDTPVIKFTQDSRSRGYYVELANQSTGGAASFSVLITDQGSAVLTCTGPGPLCINGKFKIPRRDYQLAAEPQQKLYDQTVALVNAERAYAAAHGATYPPLTQDLATSNPALSFVLLGGNPVTQYTTDTVDHGYFLQTSNKSSGGTSTFSVLMPDHGSVRLSCTDAAPLCSHGSFTLPQSSHGGR